eukprot:1160559-Pelagomonas_calceolata.AAC.9
MGGPAGQPAVKQDVQAAQETVFDGLQHPGKLAQVDALSELQEMVAGHNVACSGCTMLLARVGCTMLLARIGMLSEPAGDGRRAQCGLHFDQPG